MEQEKTFSFDQDVFIGERYQVERQIASGGLGDVYACRDIRTGNHVAVKRFKSSPDLPPEVLTQSAQEALALSSLKHPNIVSLFDVGIDEIGLFLVMELIQGKTLTEMVAEKPLDTDTFISFARQSLEGLSAAHRKGVLHLDIKPSNIMIIPTANRSLKVKIVDFGLAQFRGKNIPSANESSTVLGSVFYISPEIIQRVPPDERSDLYSLGHVFYFALVGHPAFQGEDIAKVIEAHMETPPEPLETLRPDCGLELCAWVHQLIEKNIEQRPTSAQQALHKLTSLALNYLPPPKQNTSTSEKSKTSMLDAPTRLFSLLKKKK